MGLTPEQIPDIINLTVDHYLKDKWTDLSMEFPEYIASKLISDKNITEFGGPQINFKLQVRNNGLARFTGMWEPDVTDVKDLSIEGTVPWSLMTCNWSWHAMEQAVQTDRETIVQMIMMRDHAAKNDVIELTEAALWGQPSSSTDTRPRGIPYWLQKASSANAGDFVGGDPSSGLNRAGIDSDTYTAWKNFAFTYINPTVDDMIKKVKDSIYNTNFVAPAPHPDIAYGKADRTIYTTRAVQEPLERLAENRNENLGSDVARYYQTVTIAGIPVKAVFYLDNNDTSNPLYGVNWKVFRPYVKRGWNMKRTVVTPGRPQHLVTTVHYDTMMNYVCFDLRQCFVGHVI
jgi:hypothetical protein